MFGNFGNFRWLSVTRPSHLPPFAPGIGRPIGSVMDTLASSTIHDQPAGMGGSRFGVHECIR